MNDALTAALQYAARGWHVFPCANKRPMTPHGCLDSTTDAGVIRAWWLQWPAAQVALATGSDSGIFVLDSDLKADAYNGEDSIQALEAQHDNLPDTLTAVTPSGGKHRYYKYPKGGTIKNSVRTLGPGLDTRGDGGYVIMPPSAGYFWDVIDLEHLDAVATAPDWFLAALEDAATERETHVSEGGLIPAGQRNNTMMRYAGYMRQGGLREDEILCSLRAINVNRCSPHLNDQEIRRLAASAASYEPNQAMTAMLENWAETANGNEAPDTAIPEPKAWKHPNPGAFPMKLLGVPGMLADMMQFTLDSSIRPQPLLALAAVIPALGTVAGRQVATPRGGRTNFYTLGVCESGGGKEAARQAIKRMLHESTLTRLLGPEDFASDSGLLKAVEKQPSILFQVDEIGRVIRSIGDANAAKAPHLYHIVSALLKLYSSAGSIFKGKAYADADKVPIINQPNACLYGTTVPASLYDGLTKENLTDGFLGRFLIFTSETQRPERKKPKQEPVPQKMKDALRTLSQIGLRGNLASENPEPLTYPYTGAAEDAFKAFENETDQVGINTPEGSAIWSRAPENADKLALLYAVSNYAEKIDTKGAAWGIGIARYCAARILYDTQEYVSENLTERLYKRVLRLVRQGGAAGMPRNVLTRRTQWLTAQQRAAIMQSMIESGDVTEKTKLNTGAGRPKVVYLAR